MLTSNRGTQVSPIKKKFSSHAWAFGPPMNYAKLVGRASVPATSRVKWCVKRALQKLVAQPFQAVQD
jgi:hypothetical protein